MNKNVFEFVCLTSLGIGMLLGGYLVKKNDKGFENQFKRSHALNTIMVELLKNSYEKNDELKKKLSEKEA